jgi:hypothetical protein
MNPIGGVSPSSFKILSERVPLLISSRKIHPVNLLNLPEYPPWVIKVFISSTSVVVVLLLPPDPKLLRLNIHTSRKGTVASFCVFASISTNVLGVLNSWLPTSASHRHLTCSELSKAVEIISHLRHAFNYFKIWLEGKDTPMFLLPVSSLSLTEGHVFSAIQALGQSCQLLLACHSFSSGCVLARLWAGHPTKGEPNAKAIQSKSLANNIISAFMAEMWHKEWISSPNGATTRLFYPKFPLLPCSCATSQIQ